MSMPIPRSGLPKPSSASSAQDKRTAITAYKEAMRHFSAGDYRAALPLFQKADAHVPGAMPKFRAALCYDQLGRGQEAIAAYEAFLDSGPDPQKYQSGIEQAVKRIQALRRATP